MSKQKRFIAAIVAGILALAMIVSLIASLAYSVSAASSSSIQSQIDALEQQQENISSQRTELENSISANQSKTQDPRFQALLAQCDAVQVHRACLVLKRRKHL